MSPLFFDLGAVSKKAFFYLKLSLMLPKDLLDVLACPVCKTGLALRGESALRCSTCGRMYPVRDGIPILLVQEAIEE